MNIRRILATTAAVLLAACVLRPPAAEAVIVFWDGSVSGAWGDNNNWNTLISGAGAPIAVTNNDAVFSINGGGLNLATTLAAATTINSLTFNGNSLSPVTIAAQTLTISAAAGVNGITVDPFSGNHTISSIIVAAASQTWSIGTGRILTVGAVNDPAVGDSNILLNGGGTVLLTASGSINKWNVQGSTLKLNGSGRLGDTTTSVDLNSGATLDFTNPINPSANFSDTWRGLNGEPGSTVLNFGTNTANVNLDFRPQGAGEIYRFSGNFVNASTSASLITQAVTTFGTQIIEADFPGSNNLQVLNGNIVLGNVNGAANSIVGTIIVGRADASTQPAATTVNSLVLDSSLGNHATDNRLNDLEPIILRNNGRLVIIGNPTAVTSEELGPIRTETSNTIHPHGIVTLQDGGAGIEIYSAALEHNQRTTMLVRGTGLGTGPAGSGVTVLSFDIVPFMGAGSGTETGILPYLVGDNSHTGSGTDFLTHDLDGLRLLTPAEYESDFDSGTPSNVNLAANFTTTGDTENLALRMAGGITLTIDPTDTVTISSGIIATGALGIPIQGGAILSVGAANNRITGGKLTIGSPTGTTTGAHEGYIHAIRAFDLDTTITNNGTAAVSLSKSGAGLLTISKPQTYTGESSFTEGNVTVTGANFLPASRTSISGTLTLSGAPSDSVGNIAGHLNSELNIGATTSLAIKGGADSNWWGRTTGSGAAPVALTKSGTGTVTFRTAAGFNRFTGPLTILSGGIQLFEPGPTASASPSVTIRGNGTLTLNNGTGNDTFSNNNRIGDAATITIGRGNFTITGSNNARVTETVGAITLNGALAQFTIDADDATTNTVTSSTQGDIILNAASVQRLNKATLFVRGEIGQDIAGRPDGSSASVLDTANAEGAWRLTTLPQLTSNTPNLNTTTAAILPWGTAAFGSGATVATAGGLLTYDPADGDFGTGGIQHIGFRPLRATEYSTLNVIAPSTVASAAILNQNARVIWNGPSSVASDLELSENITVLGLVLNNTSTAANDLNLRSSRITVEGGLIVSSGTQDVQVIGSATAGASITFGSAANLATAYEGRIDGGRRIDIDVPIVDNIVINGASTVVNAVSLTTDNTVYLGYRYDGKDPDRPDLDGYTGKTQINSGRIELKVPNALPLHTVLTVAEAAELRLNNQDAEIRGLEGLGFVGNENNASANDSVLVINVPAGETYDFLGTLRNRTAFTTIEGGLQLFKSGLGTQILSGVNTFTGDSVVGDSGTAAIVSAGSLIVNGSIIGRVNNDPEDLLGNVAVINSGLLGGTGLINGDVTINDFGTLAPGSVGTNTVGTFTLGSLNFASEGTAVRFDLDAPGSALNDLVNVLGDIAIYGYLEVVAGPGFAPGVYRLFNYGGVLTLTTGSSGAGFQGVEAPGGNPLAYPSEVDYFTPGQINLVVMVPEPASALGLASGAALLLGRRRRKAA